MIDCGTDCLECKFNSEDLVNGGDADHCTACIPGKSLDFLGLAKPNCVETC